MRPLSEVAYECGGVHDGWHKGASGRVASCCHGRLQLLAPAFSRCPPWRPPYARHRPLSWRFICPPCFFCYMLDHVRLAERKHFFVLY